MIGLEVQQFIGVKDQLKVFCATCGFSSFVRKIEDEIRVEEDTGNPEEDFDKWLSNNRGKFKGKILQVCDCMIKDIEGGTFRTEIRKDSTPVISTPPMPLLPYDTISTTILPFASVTPPTVVGRNNST